jgi:hypothetical protein
MGKKKDRKKLERQEKAKAESDAGVAAIYSGTALAGSGGPAPEDGGNHKPG